MMKTKLNVITRLFLLCAMIVGGTNGAWADTVLKTIDFSDSSWSGVTFSQGASDDPETINGVTFNAKSGTYHFSIADGKLTFPNQNMTSGNYALGFPVTGIVGGTVIIKVFNGTVAEQVKYTIKEGGTEYSMSDAGSGTTAQTYGIPCTIISTGLSNTKAYIYIGRTSSSYKTITKIEVHTVEFTDLDKSSFYKFYANSYTSPANLISNASLPSYVFTDIGSNENTNSNTSEVSSPHDFTGLSSSYYYRLKATNANTIAIGGLSHVKTIRFYGNGSGADGTINVAATRLSGSGESISVEGGVDYENSKQTVVEYSTGDLSAIEGYDIDTYYLYTISFAKKTSSSTNFSLWGLYIEYYTPSSYTVTYNENGGSGSIDNSTGASITLSDGTGFEAPSANYTFAGWNTNEHGTGTSYTSGQSGVKADLNLYAVWTQSGTLDGNSGSDGTYTATYNKASIDITSPPAKAGYNLTGFYKADTGNDLVATSAGVLQTSATYTDASGYWTNTSSAPTLYAQWENTHTVSVGVNSALMGSAAADDDELSEGETTTITAETESGYKFRNWTVSGDGAELSSTTTNPTTLTMGSADVTVTANFSALEHYTITYNKGTNGSGDAIANGDKTEDVNFTLSSSTYNYTNHIQTGWATSDGGDKVYELGGTYTGNAHLNLYPSWREQYTITYDANGGSGSMSDTEDYGDITLTANAYIKSGYTFIGWATSKDNADAGTVAYADGAAYNLTANATLYAIWAANDYSFAPTETSGSISSGSKVEASTGGTLTYTPADGGSPTLSYNSRGLQFGGSLEGPECVVTVTLDKIMVPGTVISATIFTEGTGTKGLNLANSSGVQKTAFTRSVEGEFTKQYTVVAGDGLAGSNVFKLKRYYLSYLRNLTVVKCITPYAVTHTLTNVSTVSGATGSIAAGENTEYTAVFSPNSGYALPDNITVTIGGETATKNTDYTWNPMTGTATVNASSVTGAIVITVVGETAPTSGTLFSLDMGTVSSTYSLSSKEELDLADYATIEGGEATLINKGAVAGYAQLTTDGGGAVQLAGTDGYIKIHLRYPLQQGDVITFTNPTNSFLISFTKTNTRSDTEKTDAGVYTCSAAMSDATTLYVWKGSMSIYNISYIRSLSIIRGVVAIKATHESGYRTFACDKALDWSGVHDGITAYTAAVDGEGKVTFTEFTGKAPATEGLLIKCEESNKNYLIPVCSSTPSAIENAMVGNVSSSTTGPGAFVLYDGEQGVGFYKTTAASFTLNANTAYFPAGVSSRSFIGLINDDEMATTVQSVAKSQAAEGQYYNLNGQKVLSPTKGLYIVDGKKIVIK